MSMTIKTRTAFETTTVLNTKEVNSFVIARAALAAAKAQGALPEITGAGLYVQNLMLSDKSDEEVITQLVRNGIRDLITGAFKDESSEANSFRVGNIKTTLRDPLCTLCAQTKLSQPRGFKRETCPYRKCGGIK